MLKKREGVRPDGMPYGGRPTKYCEELQAIADAYLLNYTDTGDAVPTVAGMACETGVIKDTLQRWEATKGHPFSGTLLRLKQIQERKLVNGGLTGAHNPAIAKLMLGNYGYHEKRHVDSTSSDGSMSPKPVLDDKLQHAIADALDKSC